MQSCSVDKASPWLFGRETEGVIKQVMLLTSLKRAFVLSHRAHRQRSCVPTSGPPGESFQ